MNVIQFVDTLPNRRSADVLGRQLLRAATSVGANYRAAKRGRSPAEFCSKLGIVEEEADECVYWLELLAESKLAPARSIAPLHREADEIVAMVVASIRTVKQRAPGKKR